jgi:hypothetical protein
MAGTEPRRAFLERAVVGGGVVVAGGVLATGLPRHGATATSPALDRRVLRYLLRLEQLQEALYREARAEGKLRGELREFVEVASRDERAHVALLRRSLPRGGVRSRKFDFGNATTNARTFGAKALQLEELVTSAYIGQAANLSPRTVAKAARIASVEARHAAWLSDIAGKHPAPRAADHGVSPRRVAKVLNELGFKETT